jgi:hypothetical protein
VANWFWMELNLDNRLLDDELNLGDSDNNDLLGVNCLFDQYLDDGSWFLLFLGNSDLNSNLLQDQFSSNNSLLQDNSMNSNLDFDVKNNLSSDDDQSSVFNLLSVNHDLDLDFDLRNHLFSLLNSDCQFSDDRN